MKKTILTLVVIVFTAGTILVSCQPSSNEKVNQVKEDVVQATQELNQAIRDSIVQFKKESEHRISINEKKIADLKSKIATKKREVKTTYEKSLTELEQQNDLLKKTLNDFKEEETDKWESFKTEFNSDMDDLGTALKNFVVKDM